jgi:hypothetical protein
MKRDVLYVYNPLDGTFNEWNEPDCPCRTRPHRGCDRPFTVGDALALLALPVIALVVTALLLAGVL